jgi:transmembrane sensor
MSDDLSWALLARYFAGECRPDEVREFEEWLDLHPERGAEVALLRSAWGHAGGQYRSPRSEEALARIADRMGLHLPGEPSPAVEVLRFPVGGRGARWPYAAAAWRIAALLFLAVAPVALWLQSRPAGDGLGQEASAGLPMKEFATHRAQRASVELVDGTRVVLAAASRLRIPADFGGRTRTVHLEGEAYFVVRRDPSRPFVVHTAQSRTEVLGTTFSVRSDREDGGTEVVVAEGRVAVGPPDSNAEGGVALARGQAARVDAAGRVEVHDQVDIASRLGWTEGRLLFRKTPLYAVRSELERWYDVQIELPDSKLADVEVTATFDNEALEPVLQTLAKLLDLEYTRLGSTVRFQLEPRR